MSRRKDSFVPELDESMPEKDFEIRQLAIECDAPSCETIDLGTVWKSLICGELQVLDHFSTHERHYLVLRNSLSEMRARHIATRLDALERVLLGEAQKVIAVDRDLAASTVTSALAGGLRNLGFKGSASRAPLQLALLVHASYGRTTIREGRVSRSVPPAQEFTIVSTPRPEMSMYSTLSPAERDVLRLRVEGKTYAEIASWRRSSTRTVANQLASVGRKLGSSRRLELVSYLFGASADAL